MYKYEIKKLEKELNSKENLQKVFNYANKNWYELCKKATGKNGVSIADQLVQRFEISYGSAADIANLLSISYSI